MKKVLLAGAALIVFGGSAMAADISRRPTYTPPPAPLPQPVGFVQFELPAHGPARPRGHSEPDWLPLASFSEGGRHSGT